MDMTTLEKLGFYSCGGMVDRFGVNYGQLARDKTTGEVTVVLSQQGDSLAKKLMVDMEAGDGIDTTAEVKKPKGRPRITSVSDVDFTDA